MKSTASGLRIEGRIIGTIANQVIASLIFQHVPNAVAQVVVILDCNAAGLLSQIVQSLLRLKSSVATSG